MPCASMIMHDCVFSMVLSPSRAHNARDRNFVRIRTHCASIYDYNIIMFAKNQNTQCSHTVVAVILLYGPDQPSTNQLEEPVVYKRRAREQAHTLKYLRGVGGKRSVLPRGGKFRVR